MRNRIFTWIMTPSRAFWKSFKQNWTRPQYTYGPTNQKASDPLSN